MSVFSKRALERPARAIQAFGIVRENAWEIGLATSRASRDACVVAVVKPDLSYAGTWTIPLKDLTTHLPEVEAEQGWALTFPASTSVAEVEDHCLHLARLSFKRWEAMQRYASRAHPGATLGDV
jgi:hypothetical protein